MHQENYVQQYMIQRSLACIVFIAVLTSLRAVTPFTSTIDGRDWNIASASYKLEYTRIQAQALHELVPQITSSILYQSLQSFYDSDDNQVLSQPVTRVVALTASQVAK